MKQLRLLIFAVFPNWDITNYPSGDKKNLNNALSLSGYSVITVKYFMPETELIKMNWWISVSLACFIYIIHLYQVLIITRHFHCMKNCPNTEFFLTVFSFRMQENTDQKKLHIWTMISCHSLTLLCLLEIKRTYASFY